LPISVEDSEEEIRVHFRQRRDQLKEMCAKYNVISKLSTNEKEVTTLAHLQEKSMEWFIDAYETIEILFLAMHQLKADFQQYEPVVRHFKEYLQKVEDERERLR